MIAHAMRQWLMVFRASDISVELVDKGFEQLRELRDKLQPSDGRSIWFFNVLISLANAVLFEYRYLKRTRIALRAWACRNLLELDIFTKFVLTSEGNARRFVSDALIDEQDVLASLRRLRLHLNSGADVTLIDHHLASTKQRISREGIKSNRYLTPHSLAELVGMKEDYTSMNRLCSKFVHPTAWSVMAKERVQRRFLEHFFLVGATYGLQAAGEIKAHVNKHGVRPRR